MIAIHYKAAKDFEIKTLEIARTGAWIQAVDPSDEEINRIVNDTKIEEGLLRDALDPFEVPRLESSDGIVYVFTRVPYKVREERIATTPIMIAVTHEFFVTISSKEVSFLDKFLLNEVEFLTTQKAKFLVQIFLQINKVYQEQITAINKQVRSMMHHLEDIDHRDIVRFVRFEETLNDFLSALTATGVVLNTLLTKHVLEFYENDKDLIEDMVLSNGQLVEAAKSALKNIVNIREAYATIMTQDLNRIIKLLTVLTIVLNVPVLVASLYGMNVALPGAQSPAAFWWVLITTGALSMVLLLLFFYKRWLK